MFENLKKRLSKRVCECINVHLEDHPEDIVFSYWESKLGFYTYVSGSFIRVDPDHIFIFLAYNFYLLVAPLIAYFLIAYTLLFYTRDFVKAVSLIHLVVAITMGIVAHVHLMFNREHLAVYIETMLRLEQSGMTRPVEDSTTRENMRLFFTKYWPPVFWFSWFLFASSQPVYQYFINSKAFVLPIELWFPFDTHTTLGFLGAFIFELLVINFYCVQAITNIPGFLFLCNMMMDEYSMLIDSLKTFHQDTVSDFKNTEEGRDYKPTISSFDLYRDAKFLECLRRRYKRIILHHQTIISLFEDLQTVSGVPLSVIFGSGATIFALGICIVVTTDDYSLRIIFAVLLIMNILIGAIVSYLGQQLTDMGENLREELYFTNWYDWPEDMKRSLRIMLARTLEPLSITSSYVTIKPNYDTYATMINSAYSFMNVLLAFEQQ